MNIKQVRIAAIVFLLACVALGVRATVSNAANLITDVTKAHAEGITRAYAWSRAACGSNSYWRCTSLFGPYCQDTAHNQRGEAQWVCSVIVFRQKRHLKFGENSHSQACLVERDLDPYGSPTYSRIRCQYGVENGKKQ